MAGVAVGLVGFAAAAFGIAPLAPDAAELPRRVVSEAIDALPLDTQLEALAAHSLALSRSQITRVGDTADSLLRRLGIADAEAAAFLRNDATARRVLLGRPGKLVSATARADGTLIELVARYPAERDQARTHFTRLTVQRDGDQLRARSEVAPLEAQVRVGSGTIRSSLFAATDEAGIADTIATQIAEIFSTDLDFHRELRRGDTFSVVYETLTADGEPVVWNQGTGRVLAAEFVNGDRVHQALWYQGRDGRGGYYAFDGQSKRRTFLASPLEFSRVTSGFAMRMHPILQQLRAHKGVDYAAPSGTPVRVVGELHAVIHPEMPRFFNSGYVITCGGQRVYHPGDALTPPGEHVDVLLAPVCAPWMKASEAVDFAREVKAPRNLAIHDRVYSEFGLGVVEGHMNMFLPKEGLEFVRLADGADL